MPRFFVLALLLAPLLAAAPVRAAPAASGEPDTRVITQITAAEVALLIEQNGGTVTATQAGEEGFLLSYQLESGLNAYVEGYACTGAPGPDAVCSDLELGGVFTADDADHALRLERELSFVWVSDFADVETNEYLVWRRDCLHGGSTRNQISYMLTTLNEQLVLVADAVWPDTGLARPSEPVET